MPSVTYALNWNDAYLFFFHPSGIFWWRMYHGGEKGTWFPKVAESSLSHGARKMLAFWQSPSVAQRKPDSNDYCSNQFRPSEQKKKSLSPCLASFFLFLFCFKLAYARKVCSQENFNLLMSLAPTVHSGLLCECNGWSRCSTPQHLFITPLFKNSFTSTYSRWSPLLTGSWGHRETWGRGRSPCSCAPQLGPLLLSTWAIYETAIIFSLWTKK